MPAKSAWYGRLDQICEEIRTLPQPWIDRQTVERIFRVRPRRAQQILQPCLSARIGNNGIANQNSFLSHLKSLAADENTFYERRRRERFARTIEEWRQDRLQRPQVLVEAPSSIVNQEFKDLPPGISLEPGIVSVRFESCQEALEKLLALAMAIGRDFVQFERLTSR